VDFNKVIVRGDGEEPLPRFRRNIPTWTAHRTLPNILREVVHDFGTKGMSLVVSTPPIFTVSSHVDVGDQRNSLWDVLSPPGRATDGTPC
jgi:hypothetical protein